MTTENEPRELAAKPWHHMPASSVLAALGTRPDGLAGDEAARRLTDHGPNVLTEAAPIHPWQLLLGQFKSPIVWILIAAAGLSGALGEWMDAGAIAAIVVLNAAIGFYQEYSAERAIAALKQLTAPMAKVRREGQLSLIPAAQVVSGDVVELEAGDLVPADLRLLEASALKVTESALTGESEAVDKHAELLDGSAVALGDRTNMAFMGTSIAAGTARGVVVGTGMTTEIGCIAGLLVRAAPAEDATSLQRRLERVGQGLVWISLAIATGIFFLGLWRGMPPLSLFLTSVSLAVAAVPEGLPAVVTIALAVGVRRMAKRHALIRRLAAVETLGAADVIATDKTGTLTVGEMTVREVWLPEAPAVAITGEGYAPDGDARMADGAPPAPELVGRLQGLARTFAACTNAAVRRGASRWEVIGDPTEGALVALAEKLSAGITEAPRLKELPFDSDRKRMTVVCQRHDDAVRAFTKGAPDSLLARCASVLGAEGVRPMCEADRQAILDANGRMADRALRVLAAAYRDVPSDADTWEVEAIERELVFVGLVGMQDPPRPTAAAAVARCRAAGIRVVMITGDHPATAIAIARELGIATVGDGVMTGSELEAMDETTLARRVPEMSVYARVSAAHKLQIVRAWQATGATIAMTGDGVNDAPALRGADAGVAMGKAGTEVAKEAAAMIITDDDFASIVAAVEEGRGVRANVRKALQYLLAGNAAEVIFIAVCVAAGLPMPLAAIQILWINLVTDGVPALALAIEPPGPGAMTRPPGGRDTSLLDRPGAWRIALVAGTTAGVVMAVYGVALAHDGEALARTSAFTVLVYARLLLALGMRSSSRAAWAMPVRSNPVLFAFVAAGLVFQPWSHYQPWAIAFFHVVPMGWELCLALAAVGSIPLIVLEAAKAVVRRKAKQVRTAI